MVTAQCGARKFRGVIRNMTEYRNENEIVIHSLGRSGSHAIVNWVSSMFKEPVYFFNNCGLEDPYKASVRYMRRVRNRPIEKFFVDLPCLKRLSETEINQYRNIHKHCLMYSYEHKDIRKLKNGEFIQNRDLVGESKSRYNILILRDVFNWLASILMTKEEVRPKLDLYPEYNTLGRKDWARHASIIPERNYHATNKECLEFWKCYAEEFLGRTNYLKDKKICVSFNQWFLNEDYRIKIADLLNLKYSDFSLDYAGSPSSFDRRNYYRGKAQEMKALERWKILKDNIIYQEILNYVPEVRDLSYEIFGKEIG